MPENQSMRNEMVPKYGVTPIFCRIVTIPKFTADGTNNNPPLALAHTFRDFRLHALRTSPGAFASTYEDEAQRSLDHTFERLRTTKAMHFVALAGEDAIKGPVVCEADMSDLLQHDWLGTVVLIGPQEDSRAISANADPLGQMAARDQQAASVEDREALHFHLNGVFVQPSARGSGMGRKLIEAALEKAREKCASSGVDGMHCTIIVDKWNDGARSLYARCGFAVVATEVYGSDRIALRMELREAGEGA